MSENNNTNNKNTNNKNTKTTNTNNSFDSIFICPSCHNVIINEIINNKLVCQFCKKSQEIDPKQKILILEDVVNDQLPEYLKLYKQDPTVGEYIIYKNKRIYLKDL